MAYIRGLVGVVTMLATVAGGAEGLVDGTITSSGSA